MSPILRRWLPYFFLGSLLIGGGLLVRLNMTKESIPPDELYQMGLSAFEEENVIALEEAVRSLEDNNEFSAHHALLKGMLELQIEQPLQAIETFEGAARHPDTGPIAFLHTGEALYQVGQLHESRIALENLLEVKPDMHDAHRWLAAIYYDFGAMDTALGHLETLKGFVPDDYRPYRMEGIINKDFERYEQAAAAYERTLEFELDSETGEVVRTELAECQLKLLQHEKVDELLSALPESSKRLTIQAQSYFARGMVEESLKAALKAIELDPENYEALVQAAEIHLGDQKTDLAVNYLNQANEVQPHDHLVHLKLSQAYSLLGDKENAQREMDIMEKYRELRIHFAELHQQAMNDSLNPQLRYELGVTAEKLGKMKIAEHWYNMTVALDKHHYRAAEALGRLDKEKLAQEEK